jgi:hypothetical protein
MNFKILVIVIAIAIAIVIIVQKAIDAYIFNYPLVLMHVTRDYQGKFKLDSFYNLREFPTPEFKTVVSPNVDTLYSSAWLNLSRTPNGVTLHVPRMSRYYLVQIMDAWTNVVADPGTRNGDSHGLGLCIKPGAKNHYDTNSNIVTVSTSMVWIIVRIQCAKSAEEYKIVHELQDGLRLEPVISVTLDPRINKDISPPQFVANMKNDLFFIDVGKLGRRKIKNYMQKLGIETNGWRIVLNAESIYQNPLARAAVAMSLLGANLPQDALYPWTSVDSAGQVLNSRNNYCVHFTSLPPVYAFWSLTLYNDEHYLVKNRINKYAIQSWQSQSLVKDSDGSFIIYIQRSMPSGTSANWLPCSEDDENFNLILRLYWPSQQLLTLQWPLPLITQCT